VSLREEANGEARVGRASRKSGDGDGGFLGSRPRILSRPRQGRLQNRGSRAPGGSPCLPLPPDQSPPPTSSSSSSASEPRSPRAVAVELDVCADAPTIESAVYKAWDAFGHIDALVNNAGVRGFFFSFLLSV
jgi:NAD(P)-dependent dehydrogenase (short-subunit alcohol dehydrogenase family)